MKGKQTRANFLTSNIKVAKEGERIFCRACGRLIRLGEQYEEKETPRPFRRVTDWITTHYPSCPKK